MKSASLRYLARTLAEHARYGRVAEALNDQPAGKLITAAQLAKDIGDDSTWVSGVLAAWVDVGWVTREPVEFTPVQSRTLAYGYRATAALPPVGELDNHDDANLWATVMSAAITLDRASRRA